MLDHIDFFVLLILSGIALAFIILSLLLSAKVRRLRLKMNQLLEEQAKVIEEADRFAEMAKNPLGPLFSQQTEPLILSFDATGKIIDVNARLLQSFGYTRKQLVGNNAVGTILPKTAKKTDDIVYRLFKNPKLFIDTETEALTKSGQHVWISWTNKVVYNKQGKPVSVDAVGFDITRRKEMEAELQYLSSIDPQTGVMNRPALLETGATELKRAKRYGRALSVVVFKFFSKKNASLTDAQLRVVTQLARSVVRSVDYLGRIGDIEFALILPETELANVPFLIQRLTQHLNDYNQAHKDGIAVIYAATQFTKKSDSIDGLLAYAWRKLDTHQKEGKK